MPDSFLPQDYTVPASEGRYLKFKEKGAYRFRIISDAIIGNQLWIDHKPLRKPLSESFTKEEIESADKNQDGSKQSPKHFMAFAVLYDNQVKILQVDQVTIQREIERLYRDEDWGSPRGYDLEVTRLEDGGKVSYSVKPKPHKELTQDQKELWDNAVDEGFNLKALFDGTDPFTSGDGRPKQAEEAPVKEKKTIAESLDDAGY